VKDLLAKLAKFDLLLAPLCGVLLTLSFAPYDLKPLAPLAIAGLFALVSELPWKRAAMLGWLFAIAHFTSGTYWIYISTHVYGGAPLWMGLMLCVLLFVFYMAPYIAIAMGLASWLGVWRKPAGWIALPVLWLLAEQVRGTLVFDGFAWFSLGDIILDTPLQAWAPVIGVHGISLLIVLMAYALWRLAVADRNERIAAAAVLMSVFAVAAALPAPGSWTEDAGPELKVAIIQGNIPQDQKWLPEMQVPTLVRYRDMTLAEHDADIIVWPEVALAQPYHVLKDTYLDPLAEQLRSHNAALLFGSLFREGDDYYNSMLAIGSASGRYNKRHLVPFGEYFPVPGFLRPLMDALNTKYSDFLFGQEGQPPIEVHGQPVGFYICFEDVFSSEFARTARDDTLIVNVTNDAWFGHSGAPAQHLGMARMRSLETGRATLRASNTGRSAVIGPDGSIQGIAGFFSTETLRGVVRPRSGLTPYMRWGDAPLWVLTGLTLAWVFWRRWKP
jgi:apolipoprotein N-acyltransferase